MHLINIALTFIRLSILSKNVIMTPVIIMKLTKTQQMATIFLILLIVILCICYLCYPANKENKKIPDMEKKSLNDYVSIETMTKDQFLNDTVYPYIKSYKKDIIHLNGLSKEETTQFQRELSLTELEITTELSDAKMMDEKNSIEVERTVTSTIEDNLLTITVFYHLTNHEDRYIQLFVDTTNNSVVKTQSMMNRLNKDKSLFAEETINQFIESFTEETAIFDKNDTEKEIDLTQWKEQKNSYVDILKENMDSFTYTYIDQQFSIYYSYDQLADILGYKISGLENSSDQQRYNYN